MSNTEPTRAERLSDFVGVRVDLLQAQYRENVSSAVAALARLRRGIGKRPGDDLDLLGLAFEIPAAASSPARSFFDEFRSSQHDATDEERSAFTAITLFAMHQQSRRDASMHRRGYSFGRSARLLGKHTNRDAVRPRFTALGTATSWDETVHHARGLIQLFRQNKIPLDYARFARDLVELQGPAADRVRMAWGRDYYRVHNPQDDGEKRTDALPADASTDDND